MEIPKKELSLYEKINSALWLVFKIGLPLGVVILIGGTLIASYLNPQRFGNHVPPRVSAVAEAVMALACLALSINCFIEAYVFANRGEKSVRSVVNRSLLYVFNAIILGSGAIVLCVLSVREWLRS